MTETPELDAVSDRLRSLESRLRTQLSGQAELQRRTLAKSRYQEVRVVPANSAGIPITWLESVGVELLLFAGRGGSWELGWSEADVDFIEEVVRAAVEGRIREVAAPGRSAAYVRRADGSTERSSVHNGLAGMLILPEWRVWARKIDYAPY